MRAVMKYPGSKWGLARWIISFFPPHHSYLEPYFGSGAVLFRKPRSNIETVNDLDSDVVGLFDCIRKDPERLARAVYFTPYSREIYERACQETPDDPFEKALYFCIRLDQGHGARTTGGRVGWKNDVQGRERAYGARNWRELPGIIMQAAERLRGVQIEHRPAVEIIRRFNSPRVLIYADPPYMLETRHGRQYHHEMTDKDHEELLDTLLAHRGPVLLSGYDSALYDDRLRGWHREEAMAHTLAGTKRIEVLWMNFEPDGQMRLF